MTVKDIYLKCSNLEYDCEIVINTENEEIIYSGKITEALNMILLLQVKRFKIIEDTLHCVI